MTSGFTPYSHRDVLHVTADGGDRGGVSQPAPIDAVEREGVVGVPEQHRVVPEAMLVEGIADAAHDFGGMPLLSQNNNQLVLSDGGPHDVVSHERRDGVVVVAELVLFTIINAVGMVLADPLAPTVQNELAVLSLFFARAIGVPNEEHVGGEALARQCRGQIVHAHSQTASRGIAVRALEAEDDEHSIFGRNALLSHCLRLALQAKSILACDTSAHNRGVDLHRSDDSS